MDNANQRRATTRADVDVPATLTVQNRTCECSITNLSLGGAQLSCDIPFIAGDRFGLRFVLAGEVIDAMVIVRWRGDSQIGVQFDGLRAVEVWAINQFFRISAQKIAS